MDLGSRRVVPSLAASREVLVAIQRTITETPGVTVNCANGTPSNRGGVIVDLDAPNGGSFVLGTQRALP